jgi:pSer/pThr/pTyr-binding forkhead associated (FHA) protein
LTIESGVLWVHDLGSKHGTLINDGRISAAPLRPGDRLSVGLSCFVADYPSPQTAVDGDFEPAYDVERR